MFDLAEGVAEVDTKMPGPEDDGARWIGVG